MQHTNEYQDPIMLESRASATEGWEMLHHLKYEHFSPLKFGLTPQAKQCNASIQTWLKHANEAKAQIMPNVQQVYEIAQH